MLTFADICERMRTYADVCERMLTYADVCEGMLTGGWRVRAALAAALFAEYVC